jgi:hypothetical protein
MFKMNSSSFFIAIIFTGLIWSNLQAQDTLHFLGHGTVQVSGALRYQSTDTDYELEAPSYPYWGTHDRQTNTWRPRKYATDNPLYHGASYIDIDTRFDVLPGFKVQANLVAEHRGMSYGVYDSRNMIVYPRIHLSADTAIHPFGERIQLHASTGHISDGSLYEGLTIYNLDWQGSNFWIKWKYFKLEYHKIGDLEAWIGLDAGDADDLIISAEEIPIAGGWKADLRAGRYRYTTWEVAILPTENNVSEEGGTVSLGIYPSEDYRLYAQYGSRDEGYSRASASCRSAYLVGASGNQSIGKLDLRTRAEYRHYGSTFNQGYIDRLRGVPKYRDGISTIGDYLYPLSHFSRPFSQWAVFTDYQNQYIDGLSLYLKAIYKLPYDVVLYGEIDLNQMFPETAEKFLWAFYDVGIGWSPRKGLLLRWTYSNKGMNLDRHFLMFYMYQDPAMNLAFEWDFKAATW